MNKTPGWKNCLLLFLLIIGLVYALPNFFGEKPSIQISSQTAGATLTQNDLDQVKADLTKEHLTYRSLELNGKSIRLLLNSIDQQQLAQDALKKALGDQYLIAISLAPSTPRWLQVLGAEPMRLGLDLRGGVHFLLQIDMQSVLDRRLQSDLHNIADNLRSQHLRYSGIRLVKPQSIRLQFRDDTTFASAQSYLKSHYPDYLWRKTSNTILLGQLSPVAFANAHQYAVDQTIETLKRRVNRLGITEATVQQQGATRISVDMPGIQDATQAKNILGKTATLEFRLVDTEHDAVVASQGVAPTGSELYFYEGHPILLKSQVVLTGETISKASSGFDQNGRAAVDISMAGAGEARFYRITGDNVGKPLAVIYVETKSTPVTIDGKTHIIYKKEKRVINVATIQSALGSPFQVTGLPSPDEAKNLALLLRAGALIAPVTIIAETNVGPSMGQQNIHQGLLSIVIGLALVIIFMALYYSVFGIIANIGLLLNLIFLVAVMSLFGAVLSFPGIAAMVLTLGMAVDANVLIFERIREELRANVSIQAAIHAGYERAFSTIVDANITTLIAAIVLFSIGSGAIKGFAVTLTIGLLTSMLTAVVYTRVIVNALYGGRKVRHLPIGMKIREKK